jgi:hypothetical protein
MHELPLAPHTAIGKIRHAPYKGQRCIVVYIVAADGAFFQKVMCAYCALYQHTIHSAFIEVIPEQIQAWAMKGYVVQYTHPELIEAALKAA